MLKLFRNKQLREICLDEAGRGCLAGPVVAAAVVWSPEVNAEGIRDSKKVSKKKRKVLSDYIKQNAYAYGIGTATTQEIDKHNILNATFMALHRAIDACLASKPGIENESACLLVDGDRFQPYLKKDGSCFDHDCVVKGDDTYVGIAAASILAKVHHDECILDLCEKYEYLKQYGWEKNMCYGTKQHMDSIKQIGVTPFHRRSFKVCAQAHEYSTSSKKNDVA